MTYVDQLKIKSVKSIYIFVGFGILPKEVTNEKIKAMKHYG